MRCVTLNVPASPGVPDIVESNILYVGELARIADQRGIAGRQCELSHDVLIGDAQTNLPKWRDNRSRAVPKKTGRPAGCSSILSRRHRGYRSANAGRRSWSTSRISIRLATSTCSALSTEKTVSATLTMIVPVCLRPASGTGINSRASGTC